MAVLIDNIHRVISQGLTHGILRLGQAIAVGAKSVARSVIGRVGLLALLAVHLAGAASAGAAETAAALRACAANYPDTARIRAAAEQLGFRAVGTFNNITLMQSPDGRSFVGTPTANEISTRCIVVEEGLSNRKALGLGKSVADAMPGASKLANTGTPDVTGAWRGMLNNSIANIYVVRDFDLGKVKGAVIMLDQK
jgi:hypothetical protein